MGRELLIPGSWNSGHHFSIASECGEQKILALANKLQFSCNQKAN